MVGRSILGDTARVARPCRALTTHRAWSGNVRWQYPMALAEPAMVDPPERDDRVGEGTDAALARALSHENVALGRAPAGCFTCNGRGLLTDPLPASKTAFPHMASLGVESCRRGTAAFWRLAVRIRRRWVADKPPGSCSTAGWR